MSVYPLVQAVDAPSVGATVLFDFNDEGAWPGSTGAHSLAERDGWSLGTPSRLANAGDPRTAWGPRRPSFVIYITGDRYAALAAHSRLARWVLRPEGWMRFQLDELAEPVWLRMLGADPGDMIFDHVHADVWKVGVSFDAEPFLYGARVDLGTLTLGYLPADVDALLTEPLGDAPARLRLTVDPSGSPTELLAGVCHSAPVVWEAESFASGTGATVTADAALGAQVQRIDFASPAMATRFSGAAPATASGLYRIWARGATYSTTAGVPTTLTVGGVTSDTVTWQPGAGTGAAWHDYGVFAIPAGLVDLPGVAGGNVTVQVSFAAGAAGLTVSDDIAVDALLLVPVRMVNTVDESSALTVSSDGNWTTLMLDGDFEVPYAMGVGGGWSVSQSSVSLVGGWPQVRPGAAENRLVAFSTSVADSSSGMTVTVSYHPRWLYLASGAS